jgi:hypothetical protein
VFLAPGVGFPQTSLTHPELPQTRHSPERPKSHPKHPQTGHISCPRIWGLVWASQGSKWGSGPSPAIRRGSGKAKQPPHMGGLGHPVFPLFTPEIPPVPRFKLQYPPLEHFWGFFRQFPEIYILLSYQPSPGAVWGGSRVWGGFGGLGQVPGVWAILGVWAGLGRFRPYFVPADLGSGLGVWGAKVGVWA